FRKERGLVPDLKRDSELAEKYGYYETSVPVTDFHTQDFEVPAGLFKNVNGSDPERARGESPDLTAPGTCGQYSDRYVGPAQQSARRPVGQPGRGEGDRLRRLRAELLQGGLRAVDADGAGDRSVGGAFQLPVGGDHAAGGHDVVHLRPGPAVHPARGAGQERG